MSIELSRKNPYIININCTKECVEIFHFPCTVHTYKLKVVESFHELHHTCLKVLHVYIIWSLYV